MGKVLFLVLIGVVVWLLFFAKKVVKRNGARQSGAASSRDAIEQMRQCARCGVHIPPSEACELAAQRGKYSCADPDNCANRPR